MHFFMNMGSVELVILFQSFLCSRLWFSLKVTQRSVDHSKTYFIFEIFFFFLGGLIFAFGFSIFIHHVTEPRICVGRRSSMYKSKQHSSSLALNKIGN
uniref:Uncharacterized protein n=1 Tax=Rhizophora mucronata TaxID=61149 RepID=A0A2P2M4R2_RHIMU